MMNICEILQRWKKLIAGGVPIFLGFFSLSLIVILSLGVPGTKNIIGGCGEGEHSSTVENGLIESESLFDSSEINNPKSWESVTPIGNAENYSHSYLIELSKDENKIVYKDSQTGYITWQLTENIDINSEMSRETIPYYNVPVVSPDGKYIVYQKQTCTPDGNPNPYCQYNRYWVMKSDGGDEHILGKKADWDSLGANYLDWNLFGTFSRDAKYYYVGGKHGIFRITLATNLVEKIYNSPFYHSAISPDGTTLLGSDVEVDDEVWPQNNSIVTFKFFNLINSEYWDFPMTFEYGVWKDCQRFWIGNDNIFFTYYSTDPKYYSMKYDGSPVPTLFEQNPYLKKRQLFPVLKVDKNSKTLAMDGSLNVDDYIGDNGHQEGIWGHITLNDVAAKLGNSEGGMVAGDGHSFEYANSNFTTVNPEEREHAYVFEEDSWPYKDNTPRSIHSNFSRDGKSYIVDNTCIPGIIYEYDVAKIKRPKPIVRYLKHESFYTGEIDPDVSGCNDYSILNSGSQLQVSPRAQFSPDGTKINYGAFNVPIKNIGSDDLISVENQDLYQVIYKKPKAPSKLTFLRTNMSKKRLKWKPAPLHKEIQKYEIFWSPSRSGNFVNHSEFTPPLTYLSAESDGLISANETTINVDSTDGFPESRILLEIEGLNSMEPSEIVICKKKTPTSFIGCKRGELGTKPSKHWNDSFVWGEHSIEIAVNRSSTGYYKVKAIEHSGLESDLSQSKYLNY